jgi:HAD superfamily hydrolase (TIGR01509 family)
MQPASVSLGALEAVFLDAGNTLIHWDHAFVCERALALGFPLEPERLARAESAARPLLDQILAGGRSTEAPDTISAYLECMLAAGLAAQVPAERHPAFVSQLAAALRGPEANDRLWSLVHPDLPEALAGLRDAGLVLVVVSNSDGSCERKLRASGLRGLVDAVIDSAVVGVEKPDPGIFRHALAQSGRPPQRTLHVGDFYAIDVVGARRAGLAAALVDPHDDWGDVDCMRFPDVTHLARAILAAKGA